VPGGAIEKNEVDPGQERYTLQEQKKYRLERKTIPSLRPKILYKEKAEYTKEARDRGIQGKVILDILFRADGKIDEIKVVRGLPDGLTEKAREAAQKIRFEPAMKDGVPVSVRGKLEYSFNLGKKGKPIK